MSSSNPFNAFALAVGFDPPMADAPDALDALDAPNEPLGNSFTPMEIWSNQHPPSFNFDDEMEDPKG